jgi:hypothetical protein
MGRREKYLYVGFEVLRKLICGVLGYEAVWSGRRFLMFWSIIFL